MTVHSLTMHAAMFVSSFIAGIALYYFIAIEELQLLLHIIEPVLSDDRHSQQLYIVLRTVITFSVITIFASNPILSVISYFLIAAKITLFSLCSMYLVVEHQNVLAYSIWWFPVQLLQCIVFIAYYARLKAVRQKTKKVVATILLFSIIEISILLAELVIIRYV